MKAYKRNIKNAESFNKKIKSIKMIDTIKSNKFFTFK